MWASWGCGGIILLGGDAWVVPLRKGAEGHQTQSNRCKQALDHHHGHGQPASLSVDAQLEESAVRYCKILWMNKRLTIFKMRTYLALPVACSSASWYHALRPPSKPQVIHHLSFYIHNFLEQDATHKGKQYCNFYLCSPLLLLTNWPSF